MANPFDKYLESYGFGDDPLRAILGETPPTGTNQLNSLLTALAAYGTDARKPLLPLPTGNPFCAPTLAFLQPPPTTAPAPRPVLNPIATVPLDDQYNGWRYWFDVRALRAQQASTAGVYCFLRRELDGRWSVIYIGETGSFRQRLVDQLALHHKWQNIRRYSPTHIGTLHVPGARQGRLDIETGLVQAIHPPCND